MGNHVAPAAALIKILKTRDIQAVIIESTGQFHVNAYNRMAAARSGANVCIYPFRLAAEWISKRRVYPQLSRWLGLPPRNSVRLRSRLITSSRPSTP
jgi:hypothetical protein